MATETSYYSSYTGEQVDTAVSLVLDNQELLTGTDGVSGSLSSRMSSAETSISSYSTRLNSLEGDMALCLKQNNNNVIYKPLTATVSTKDTNGFTVYPSLGESYQSSAILINKPEVEGTMKPLYYIKDTDTSGYFMGLNPDDGSLSWYYNKNGTVTDPLARITNIGQVYGAVWNDYAEFRKSGIHTPGAVICENGDGSLCLSKKRLQAGAKVISDTFGFAIGQTNECQTPVAVSGRVLAIPHVNEKFKVGDCVCAGPHGTVSRMNRLEVILFPDRIIGTVSEIPNYSYWGLESVPVNGRIWISLK